MEYPSYTNSGGTKSAATVLASGTKVVGKGDIYIQNCSTATMCIKLGAGASTSDFDIILKGCTVQDDGTGGAVSLEIYPDASVITAASSSTLRYTVAYR